MKRAILFSQLEHSMHVLGKKMYEEQAAYAQYSPAQSHVLMIVGAQGNMGIKQLATMLCVTSGAATQHVGALEKAGLLVREISTTDRREVVLKITETGKDTYQRLRRNKTQVLRKVFRKLSDDELQALVGLVEKVSGAVKNKKGQYEAV
jgi:DNA-binding MarR family transcriptional regulator